MERRGTYRVQLHAGFPFEEAARVVPYLADLGVSHLYCSPYLQAAAGSTHGYDVVDHSRLNDELGGEPGHRRLVEALGQAGLSQVLDIVPNHMAVAGRANRWWWDVLENGPSSRYASYFDIDWHGPDDKDEPTVLVPILGDHYGRVLEAGELRVAREGGSFAVAYYDHELPLSPRTLAEVVEAAAARARSTELSELAQALASLPHASRTDVAAVRERHRQKELLRERLAGLCGNAPAAAKAIDAEIDDLNADVERLDRLLRRQNFRLAYWRTASEELDYRRFFNIETLVGLRVEDEAVFADTHRVVLELVGAGIVEGLRIDHVDGLHDPEGYLVRLREASGGVYTVVEKILEPDEELPGHWPVEGTSGYDFLTRVNNLFVATANEQALTGCYERFTSETGAYDDVVYASKHQVMAEELASEVERLTRLLADICDGRRRHRDHTRRELRTALSELLAAFPVYRTYVQPRRPISDADRAHVSGAVAAARKRRPDMDAELFEFLGELLVLRHPGADEVEFAVRFAQVSAPVMAKGVEDTAFYRYNRLISLNEVGGDPGVFGRPVDRFHADTEKTAQLWPEGMLTLSTHDTKRSADVRARINLLSEMPEAWEQAIGSFAEVTQRHRQGEWPDRNAEYLLYQTLVGAWPIDADRLVAFMEKATREAKVHTSWVDPVPEYDRAVEAFTRALVADEAFLGRLEAFLAEHRLVERGRVSSLAQTTLLLTCPGVPDLYQGTELWDLSLVDPDNRRPVDYPRRARLLGELTAAPPPGRLADDHAGVWKLRLVSRLLHHRSREPDAYRSQHYEPLATTGAGADHLVAFTRGRLAVVVPRLVASLAGDWADTHVSLPSGRWSNLLSGAEVEGGPAAVAGLLAPFPAAVLSREGG